MPAAAAANPTTPVKAKSPAPNKTKLTAAGLNQVATKNGSQRTPQTAKDKIKGWQAGVGADDDDPPAAATEDKDAADEPSKRKPEIVDWDNKADKPADNASKDAGQDSGQENLPPDESGTPKARGAAKPPNTPRIAGKTRTAGNANVRTAPKKRVVSDGAWRKPKSPPKTAEKAAAVSDKDGANDASPGPRKTPSKAQLGWVRPSVRNRARAVTAPKETEVVDEPPADEGKLEAPAKIIRRESAEMRVLGIGTPRSKRNSGQRKDLATASRDSSLKIVDNGSGDRGLKSGPASGDDRPGPPDSPSPPQRKPARRKSKAKDVVATQPKVSGLPLGVGAPFQKYGVAAWAEEVQAVPLSELEPVVSPPMEDISVRKRRSSRQAPKDDLDIPTSREVESDLEVPRRESRRHRRRPTAKVEEAVERLLTANSREVSRARSCEDFDKRSRPAAARPIDNSPLERNLSDARRVASSRKPNQADDLRRDAFLNEQEAEAPPPAPIFGAPAHVTSGRIEAWLTNTPDPFVDGERSPSKARSSGKKEERARDGGRLSPLDDIAEATRTPSRRERQTRGQRSSSFNVDEVADRRERSARTTPERGHRYDQPEADDSQSKEPPTSPLRRSGARKAVTADRRGSIQGLPRRDGTVLEDDDGASSQSSVDPTTIDIPGFSPRNRGASVPLRRAFPSTGKRLSTIVSVETFHTKLQAKQAANSDLASEIAPSQVSMAHDSATLPLKRSGTKGRMAKHSDLMSVLSISKPEGNNSIVSARSVRSRRNKLDTVTIDDLLKELTTDEGSYMRELRTLVDGVIPVLLSCVLSKSEAAVAAGLFSESSTKNDTNVTRPIIDMGVALERLKSTHKRIPLKDVDALLSWATNAQRIYADYIKTWRLGFQGVVVNLAPGEEKTKKTGAEHSDPEADASWDEGLGHNAQGDIVNHAGERVDVAFLLKRPLVRLKYLSKTLEAISVVSPSQRAETVVSKYQALVNDARKRTHQERARLEDEAAAAIDPTRSRDPQSLAPLAGVGIDPNRCVTARDYFDLNLPHSSGQEIDCRVELLIRDDAAGQGGSGDVLICEVDNTGRWLLFPPIQQGRISSRSGYSPKDLVVMIRGFHSGGEGWQELLTLRCGSQRSRDEWSQMLGTSPVPPKLERMRSFVSADHRPASSHGSSLLSAVTGSTAPINSRSPSPRDVEVPIGERANSNSKKWRVETPDRRRRSGRSRPVSPITPPDDEGTFFGGRQRRSPVSPPSPEQAFGTQRRNDRHSLPSYETHRNDLHNDSDDTPTKLRRSKATKRQRHRSRGDLAELADDSELLCPDENTREPQAWEDRRPMSAGQGQQHRSSWQSDGYGYDTSRDIETTPKAVRPSLQHQTSSVPTMELPKVNRLRKNPQPETPSKYDRQPYEPANQPSSAPAKLQKRRSDRHENDFELEQEAPSPPPHRSTPRARQSRQSVQFDPVMPTYKSSRRTSSPLKHEYAPSSASEGERSDRSYSDDDSCSIYSSDEDGMLEDYDIAGPLPMDINEMAEDSPASIVSLPDNTLAPSQSASQAPYRTVPAQAAKAARTIAAIFSWSDLGRWDSLHPDDCSIIVSPGLIEAFELNAAHSLPLVGEDDQSLQRARGQPLVALELTPLVPLRRGTALDISIRSPATANSQLKAGQNVMFRSRTSEECEALYKLINQARINNPTFIALQNARGPYGESTWAEAMDRRNSMRRDTGGPNGANGSFWGHFSGLSGRSRSYRSRSQRAPSTTAVTDSSVSTMQTAFSALKRFSNGKLFNLTRSTLASSRGISSFNSSNQSGGGGSGGGNGGGFNSGSSSPIPGFSAPLGPLGMQTGAIASAKIRLYERETASKWRDMGSARLSILDPSPHTKASAAPKPSAGNGDPRSANPSPPASAIRNFSQPGDAGNANGSGGAGAGSGKSGKRILIVGKTKGETLLDVTLSESCFERVARTGIAVSVWEDVVGPDGEVGRVGAVGTVGGVRARVFMIQLKSEREAAFAFSLLGKLRY